MSQTRIKKPKTIKSAAKTEQERLLWNKAMNEVGEALLEVNMACPGCMARDYTLQQLQDAVSQLKAAQGPMLYDHYNTEGSGINPITGIVTINMSHEDCKYKFMAYNVALNTIDEAIDTLKMGTACGPESAVTA